MTNYQKISAGLLLASSLLFTVGASATANSNIAKDKVLEKVENKARSLMRDLKRRGFEVSRGHFKTFDKQDCGYTFGKIGMCGNNPAAPYTIFAVPPWKEEFVDPVLNNIFGPSQPGYNDVFRLDPQEAIVILGHLPPPGAFFSEQTFLLTREGSFDENSDRYKDVNENFPDFINIFFKKLNDKRVLSFASLSNPNNNAVIDRLSGDTWNQLRYFIITPDKYMDSAVRTVFSRMAIKDKDIFTEPIPSDMKVGLSEGSDDFSTILRYAHPQDGGAPGTPSDAWRKNPPLVVMRIRDTRTNREPQKYPPVMLETRTATDERPLKSDLSSLMAAVGRRWGQPCATPDCSDQVQNFMDLQGFPVYMVGPLCNLYMENCLADTWDASYQIRGPLTIDSGEIYAIAGTLGTKTRNATYVGLSVNQLPGIIGITDINDRQLEGTAASYSGEVKNSDKFFLYYFARDCSGLEHLTGGHCLPLSMIPPTNKVAIGLRDYLRPGTQRGPDSALLMPPMVLKLHRP